MRVIFYPLIIASLVSSAIGNSVVPYQYTTSNKQVATRDALVNCSMPLDLSNLSLPSIGPNFITNRCIDDLRLSNDGIKTISKGAFDGLSNLIRLDLSYNNLTDLFSFGANRKLEVLILDNNYNGAIPISNELKITNDYPRLLRLSLRNTRLTSIAANLSIHVPLLEYLDISDNRIQQFDNIPKSVTHLNVQNSHYDILSKSLNNALQHVVSLNLNDNRLTAITSPGCTSAGVLCLDLPKLEELSVARCGIINVSEYAFISMKNLTRLNLSGNKIKQFGDYVLSSLERLTFLDLSDNPLSTEPKFGSLSNLSTMVLDDVNDRALIGKILSQFKDDNVLTSLSLKDNRLEDLKVLAKFKKLEVLNLSKNIIKKVDLPVELNQLIKLDLSNNLISDMDNVQPSLVGKQSLQTLNLQGNPITKIKVKSFRNITDSLEILIGPVCLPNKK